MRTSGDDIGEVLAMLGVLPVWDAALPQGHRLGPFADRAGRPRIDVTVRDLGFLRDAFPHVLACWTTRYGWWSSWTSRRSRTSSGHDPGSECARRRRRATPDLRLKPVPTGRASAAMEAGNCE